MECGWFTKRLYQECNQKCKGVIFSLIASICLLSRVLSSTGPVENLVGVNSRNSLEIKNTYLQHFAFGILSHSLSHIQNNITKLKSLTIFVTTGLTCQKETFVFLFVF